MATQYALDSRYAYLKKLKLLCKLRGSDRELLTKTPVAGI